MTINPQKVFRIRSKTPDFACRSLIIHYKLGSVDNYEAGPFDPVDAAAMLKSIVARFEENLLIIDYSVELMKVTNHPDLEEFERNQEIIHRNVNNFY